MQPDISAAFSGVQQYQGTSCVNDYPCLLNVFQSQLVDMAACPMHSSHLMVPHLCAHPALIVSRFFTSSIDPCAQCLCHFTLWLTLIILCVASGPEGANLFILNLPPDATDDTLRSIFGPYGNVVSTLVYMDKITKMSKQFGLSQSLF